MKIISLKCNHIFKHPQSSLLDHAVQIEKIIALPSLSFFIHSCDTLQNKGSLTNLSLIKKIASLLGCFCLSFTCQFDVLVLTRTCQVQFSGTTGNQNILTDDSVYVTFQIEFIN